MKLNKSVFRYIEHELYNYEATKREIAEIREDIITEVPQVSELCTSIQSGKTSNTTAARAEKLLTNSMLIRMCRTVDAIDRALRLLDEGHNEIFVLKYKENRSWQETMMKAHVGQEAYFRKRRELVQMVAQQMGYVLP